LVDLSVSRPRTPEVHPELQSAIAAKDESAFRRVLHDCLVDASNDYTLYAAREGFRGEFFADQAEALQSALDLVKALSEEPDSVESLNLQGAAIDFVRGRPGAEILLERRVGPFFELVAPSAFVVYGPDQCPIRPEPFGSRSAAEQGLEEYVSRFRDVGYYEGDGYKIPLGAIDKHCTIAPYRAPAPKAACYSTRVDPIIYGAATREFSAQDFAALALAAADQAGLSAKEQAAIRQVFENRGIDLDGGTDAPQNRKGRKI
jgi:hypothetical protein